MFLSNVPNLCKLSILISPILLATALLPVKPGLAQVCSDLDGDGWGWDGSQTCVVSVAPVAAPAVCSDTDGDGWGWDGSQTCLVSAAPQTPNQTAIAGSGAPGTGQCEDLDGDGWGWNGTATCTVESAVGSSNSPSPAAVAPIATSGSYDPQRDLIALHFDHAPDRDDGHAAVAALMVTRQLNLTVQVVAGTYGLFSSDRYVAASEPLMSIVWGSQWLNAHRDFNGSVNTVVNRWASVLAAGGSIWVAEGGPSDFTAAVVARLQSLHSEFDTRQRIHLIQHSVWNEDHSSPVALDYVRANTRYVNIDDGNNPNATADLRFESHNNGAFVSRALTSNYANEWAAAFAYLSPSEKLDFSDVVEMLHILGIGSSQIRDVNDFGDFFF